MKNNNKDINNFLPLVQKPGRYTGGEVNSIKKDLDKVDLTFGLIFPDVYEIGMSTLGMQILYRELNSSKDIACERVFSPWQDMEDILRRENISLTTIENSIPLKDLDIIGFSLSYEMAYSNILNIMDLSDITLIQKDRREDEPFIIAGGSGVCNPEPVADFFDAIFFGDGEMAVTEIANTIKECKKKNLKRIDTLLELSNIEGIYVPSFYEVTYKSDNTVKEVKALKENLPEIKRRIVPDLNAIKPLTEPIIANVEAIHDRLSVEVMRGCTRGCRFCQAGMVYRPDREREPGNIKSAVREGLEKTGYEEVSLLSLSTGDYFPVESLIFDLMKDLQAKDVSLSLPSMRVGTLSEKLAREVKKVRKSGFTLAPEAGTARLRRVINKDISEEDLLANVENIFNLGWQRVKLYFMIGLPTETNEDLDAIISLGSKVKNIGRKILKKNPTIVVSASTFVPKPFTPFQWHPQISKEECKRKQDYLRGAAQKAKVDFKWHDRDISYFEGVMSRGDRRLSKVILKAFEDGARFDGWDEFFNLNIWTNAFKSYDIDPDFYTLRTREKDEVFPWDHLNQMIDKEFLYKENEKSLIEEITEDCKDAKCTNCGTCDHKIIKNIFFDKEEIKREEETEEITKEALGEAIKVRFVFSKTGNARFLSLLETSSVFRRAIRRTPLKLKYSQGFNPKPKLSFVTPLPVGIESLDELLDVEFLDKGVKIEDYADLVNKQLPQGFSVKEAKLIDLKNKASFDSIKAQEFVINLDLIPQGINIDLKGLNGIKEVMTGFLNLKEIFLEIVRGKKRKEVNIRPLIEDLRLVRSKVSNEVNKANDSSNYKEDKSIDSKSLTGLSIVLRLKKADGVNVRPFEVLKVLFNLSDEQSLLLPIVKTATIL